MTTHYEEKNAAQLEEKKFWSNLCFMVAISGACAAIQMATVHSTSNGEQKNNTSAQEVPLTTKNPLKAILHLHGSSRQNG